jgi:hypothetical protein
MRFAMCDNRGRYGDSDLLTGKCRCDSNPPSDKFNYTYTLTYVNFNVFCLRV